MKVAAKGLSYRAGAGRAWGGVSITLSGLVPWASQSSVEGLTVSGLQQLNVRYEPLEDRLMLNVNTADGGRLSVWMTRRFTRLLITLLESMTEKAAEQSLAVPMTSSAADDAVADAAEADVNVEVADAAEPAAPARTREAVKSFQRENALAKADFTTEYRAEAEHYPLGEEALLASRIDYKPLDNGSLSLTFAVDEKQGVNLVLDRDLQFAFIKLLEEGAAKAEWDLIPAKPAEVPPLTVTAGDKVVH